MFQLTWNKSISTIDPNIVLQALYKSPKLKALDSQIMLCYGNSCKEQLLTSEFKVLCDWQLHWQLCQCLLQPLAVEIFLSVLLSLCSAETKTQWPRNSTAQKEKQLLIAKCIRSCSDLKVCFFKNTARPWQLSISTINTTLNILINSWMKEGEFKFICYSEWFLFRELMRFARGKLQL